MGTDLPIAGAPLGATRGGRRIVFVIIEAPPRFKICARDMRAGGESTRREKPMSTRTDDDVESMTDDVVLGLGKSLQVEADDGSDRAGGVPLATLRDLEAGPFEHRERAVEGVR